MKPAAAASCNGAAREVYRDRSHGSKPLVRFLFALLALAASVLASEHHGIVKFNGVPVPGATVTASQGEKKFVAITDAQGVYAFADLPDGIWNLRVEMLCFEPLTREIAVAPEAPSPEWELKLLSLDAIKAEASSTNSAISASVEKNSPAASAPAAPNGNAPAPSLAAAAAAVQQQQGKPGKGKGKKNQPAASNAA